MKMLKLAPLLLCLAGCLEERINLGPPVRLTAGVRYTTELGFVVYWPCAEAPPLVAIDELALDFLAEFGGTIDQLTPYPIYVADDVYLPGGWLGMTWYYEQVDVTRYGDGWDRYLGRRLVGLEWLIHEWLHVTQGRWHPE